jgi:hypothetical protein
MPAVIANRNAEQTGADAEFYFFHRSFFTRKIGFPQGPAASPSQERLLKNLTGTLS